MKLSSLNWHICKKNTTPEIIMVFLNMILYIYIYFRRSNTFQIQLITVYFRLP